MIEPSKIASALVAVGIESAWGKVKRKEAVLRLLHYFKLDPANPPTDFEGIYNYTLIEYSASVPRPVLNFFRNEFVRNAFRESLYKNDWSILQKEAEGIIEWNEETGKLGRIDYDPRREFATFSALFQEAVDRTRTPVEVKQDLQLKEINDKLSKLDALDEVKAALANLLEKHTLQSQIGTADELTHVCSLLEAIGYRIIDIQAIEGDLYCLCETKSGPEILQRLVCYVHNEVSAANILNLSQAIIKSSAESGTLLTRHALPTRLQRTAIQQRMNYYTLAEFTDRLANFRPYLHTLITNYEMSNIPKFYIEPTIKIEGSDEKFLPLFSSLQSFIDKWLLDPTRNQISLLGDFGSGKTWFSEHCAYLAARRYFDDPAHNRIPIRISLRDYSRAYDIEQLITDAIINHCKVNLHSGYKTFEQLNEAGKLLLIFDGFDEMERRISDFRTTADNFWELAKVVKPASKVLLTCRTLYFRDEAEAQEILTPRKGKVSVAIGSQQINLENRKGFEIVHLQDFTDKDILQALQLRQQTGWEYIYKKIQTFPNLQDLASRPVFLDLLVQTIPLIQDAGSINVAMLYEIYTTSPLNQRYSPETDNISPKDRLSFLENIAWEMYQEQKNTITEENLQNRIKKYFNIIDEQKAKNFIERDIHVDSFFARDGSRNYSFIHKSFLEYFVAHKMAFVLQGVAHALAEALDVWRVQPLASELRDFLKDMVSSDALWGFLRAIRERTGTGYAAGNALTLLRLKGVSLAKKNLSRFDLARADLYNSNLAGADLRSASLRGANLHCCSIQQADLRNADLTNAYIGEMGSVESVRFDATGEIIAGGSADGIIRLWRWRNQEQIGQFFGGTCATSVCFSADGSFILAGVGSHGHIKMWDRQSGNLAGNFSGHTAPVWSLQLCPGRQAFASSAHDGSVRIWDMRLGIQLEIIHTQARGLWDISYSPDGQYLAVAEGQDLVIYATQTYDVVWRSPEQTIEVRGVQYSSNGLLAYTAREGVAYIYDAQSKLSLSELRDIPVGPNTLAFSPDGQRLAVGGSGRSPKIQIWATHTYALLEEMILGEPGYIGMLDWSRDGYLVSGSSNGLIHVWNMHETKHLDRQPLRTLHTKMNFRGTRIGGTRGLDAPAPDSRGSLRDWLISRGAIE